MNHLSSSALLSPDPLLRPSSGTNASSSSDTGETYVTNLSFPMLAAPTHDNGDDDDLLTPMVTIAASTSLTSMPLASFLPSPLTRAAERDEDEEGTNVVHVPRFRLVHATTSVPDRRLASVEEALHDDLMMLTQQQQKRDVKEPFLVLTSQQAMSLSVEHFASTESSLSTVHFEDPNYKSSGGRSE